MSKAPRQTGMPAVTVVTDTLRAYGAQWWRFGLLQLLALFGLSAVIGVVAWLVQSSGKGLMAYLASDLDQLEQRAVGIATILIVGIALVLIPFLVAAAAATARVTDATLSGESARLWRSLGRGFARFLPILGTLAVAVVLSAVVLVASPFIVLGGLLGLAATGVIALIRRRKPGILPKWPGWRVWGFAAIPFAVFGRVTAGAVLMFPAAVLEPAGPLLAYRSAERVVAGRRWHVLAVSVIALGVAMGLSIESIVLGAALWGGPGASLLGVVVQLLALPIPIVTLVALYRRTAWPTGRVLEREAPPAPARAKRAASPAMARIASVTVVALFLSPAAVFVPASPAAAAPVDAGAHVSLVVTSAADTVDTGELGAQQASCLAAGPDCTLRAALGLAAAGAADGALSATIGFADDMTIGLAETLTFQPTEGSAIASGTLAIDGSGHKVVLDGGNQYQILSVVSTHWNLSVSGVTFQHGSSGSFGGAISAGVPETTLQSVVFDGNTAFSGGGAVFAQALTVRASTFLGSHATSYTGGTYGGAIRATGQVSIVNSTFSGSGTGDQFTPGIDHGSDVYADEGMTVVNSTFVNSEGGSLASQNTTSEIRNSLFTTDWTQGGAMCSGTFTGGANFSREGDSTCPGTSGVRFAYSVVDTSAPDSSGLVPVFPIIPNIPDGNPAIGAGTDCPATDALGATRASNGCDLGAVEFFGQTTLTLDAIPSTTVAGSVTVRATMTSDSSAIPQGSVTFTFDGIPHGPIALNDPGAPGDNPAAETVISGLNVGDTYAYSAAFTPSGPLLPSSAGPLDYTVLPLQVSVDLLCSNPAAPNPLMAPECVGDHWNISDTESIHLVAKVVDDQAGKVSIALDPAGATVVAGPERVVDGEGTFTIPASKFGLGLHTTLHAIYQSDDGQHSGVSPIARSLMVLRTPTIAISAAGSTGVYGDRAAGAVTVTVTGAAATPTGTVSILGREATLDSAGQAILDLSDLSVAGGKTALVAQYGGDAVYGGGESDAVSYRTTAAATSTKVTGTSPVSPQVGEPTTVTVLVDAMAPSTADPQGSVALTVDGAKTFGPVSGGTVTTGGEMAFTVVIPADALGAGTHKVVATFTGGGNFSDSTSSNADLSIGQASTTTALTASPMPAVWGDQITLTATVDATGAASIPTGAVSFSAGDKSLGTATLAECNAPNPDGCAVATLTVAASAVGIGTVDLTAAYQGARDLTASADTIAGYTVAQATPTVTVTGQSAMIYGESATYTVTVGTSLAEPADGTKVVVTVVPAKGDPVPLGTVVLEDGSGTIAVPTIGTLVPGSYQLTASFAGDTGFEAATGTIALDVSAAVTGIALDSIGATTVVYGGTIDVGLTVANESGSTAPEGDVVVSWGGHEVGRVTLTSADDTDVAGVRTIQIPADFGNGIPAPIASWLTAAFVPASGFAASQLSSDAPDERKWVTVTPLQTEVAVDVTAVLGQPLAAVATVGIAGDNLGITPGGQVTFLVTKSGEGTQEVGPAALVNGKATLADALGPLSPITVDLAGSWSVRATYSTDSDLRYVATSPQNTAKSTVNVTAGTAAVTVDAPASVQVGVPLVVKVKVLGAVTATGKVRIQLPWLGVVVSDEVPLVDGAAEITMPTPTVGSHEFVVHYAGDGTLNEAVSDSFTVVVGKTATTTTLDTTSRVADDLYPGIVGGTVHYSAHVEATVGTPAGLVRFSRGTTPIGQATLDEHGDTGISVIADEVWSGDIVAEFIPFDAVTVAGSTGTLAHSWVHPPVTVALQGASSSVVGSVTEYTVAVQFDWMQFQFLDPSLGPPHGPSGPVTVSDGNGASCVVQLSESSTQLSTGTCDIRFDTVGSHKLTASYGGDAMYLGGVSAATTTTVSRGTPVLTLTTPSNFSWLDGDQWGGLTTIPVTWSVTGPSNGTVTVQRGTETVCTSSSLTGSCDVAIPAYQDTQDGNTFTLEYSGTPQWYPRSTSNTGTIIACIPYQEPTSNPTGSATVTVSPAPTCGGGTGYYTTDTVAVSATPGDIYRVTGFSGGLVPGSSRSPYPAADVSLSSYNGSASMTVHPKVQLQADGRQIPFGVQANTTPRCVTVYFGASGIANRLNALNMISWDAPTTCGGGETVGPSWVSQSIPIGATVQMAYQPQFMPAYTKFYGWQGLASGDPFAKEATYTVGPDGLNITAAFGPICYDSAPNVVQPSDGTITLSLPARNCNDPQTGKTGWVYGTPGSATLLDTTGSTYQAVTVESVGYQGRIDSFQSHAWVPQKLVYFDGWGGDTGSWTEGSATVGTDGSGVRRQSHPISFQLGESPFTIGAAYGTCAALKTQVNGDASSGSPGTITVNTPSNCPLGSGYGGEHWYRSGTKASVTETASGKVLKFLGWSGLPLARAQLLDATATFTLDADATATASFGTNTNCRPFTLSTFPAGALNLDTTFTLGQNACAAMYGPKFYDQGVDGNGIIINPTPATAAANGAETVFAWTTNTPRSASGGVNGISSVWTRTDQLSQDLYGDSTIIAYACEFVAINANVSSPSGELVSGTGAANISRESQSQLGDFLITQPADCATGADPRSGYGGYAWLVGTQLQPVVTADPVAYRFTGWSGDVSGTGDSPDAPLSLVGPGRHAQGDNYNYRVTANFQAICYTLSLPSDADKLEVVTAPNCPGVDASKRMYLGGTAVVVHAADKGDTLFRNWVSGVDAVDSDSHWASVVMTSAKTVVPYYSSKSVGEQLSSYGAIIGDALAVGSKKILGVVTAAVSAYVKVLVSSVSLVASAISYTAEGLEYLGVHGAFIDGMKSAATAMTSMMSMLFAPMDCMTAWSAGGENTMIYAAQNAIGTAIVTALSEGAAQPEQAPAQTTFQKLQAKAAAVKAKTQPVRTAAASAITAAKSIYDAAKSGNIGVESSAYDAWASQSSVSVFSSCMADNMGGAATSVMSVVG